MTIRLTAKRIEAREKEADTAMSLEVQRRKIPELEAQIASAERAEAEAAADAAKTSLSALAETQVKAASLQEELTKASDRLKGRTLSAPVDGTVQELAIHTIGAVSGLLVERLGWTLFYTVCMAGALPGMALMLILLRRGPDIAKPPGAVSTTAPPKP